MIFDVLLSNPLVSRKKSFSMFIAYHGQYQRMGRPSIHHKHHNSNHGHPGYGPGHSHREGYPGGVHEGHY